jgi:drug/metabolite transporter (DMT)-like permease
VYFKEKMMKLRDVALLFLLAGVWGASFLFVRMAVPVLGPFPLVAMRVLLGGLILLGYAASVGHAPNWRLHWRRYLMIGLLNNAIPFTLIATAQLHLTASFAALLNATTPLFSAMVAALWIKDKLTAAKISGLLLGITGVGVIVGWQPVPLGTEQWVSILLMLGATCSYGVAAVYGRVAFSGVNAISTATGQLMASSAMMLPLALLNPPTKPIEPVTIVAMLGLAVLSTALAYLIYFHLIRAAGPTTAASVTLLIPFFSSLWGSIFLGEQLFANEVIGFGIILVGLLLVTGLWKQVKNLLQPQNRANASTPEL